MRARIECALYGFAGASVQASGGLHFELKEDKSGEKPKMQLRGGTKKDEGFAGAGGEAFIGVKAGGEITGNGEWQNPENNKEWATLMSVGAAGEVAAGAGAEANFYITYEKGKFIARAKAALVWGGGAGGEIIYSVNVDTIAEFCIFVYHQLKNNDFNFLDLMSEDAFKYFDLLTSYALLVGNSIEDVYEKGIEMGIRYFDDLYYEIKDALNNLKYAKTRQQEAETLAERILANPDFVLFQPPESKGRLLHSLCNSYWFSFEEKQEEAIIAVLKRIQTWNEYKEIMEHLTEDGSRIGPKPATGVDNTYQLGERIIWNFLDGIELGEYVFQNLRFFMKRNEDLKTKTIEKNTKAIRDNGVIA